MHGDLQLVSAWRGGDARAGVQLFDRHYAAVARFFRTKVAGDAEDDLVQETFTRCVAAAARYRGDGSFRAFLFGIAYNVLVDYVRRVSAARKLFDPAVQSARDAGPGPRTNAAAREQQRRVVEALQCIPLVYQTTLELHYWEQLGVDDIARVLDCPPGTVKTRLRKGRALLAAALEGV